MSETMKKFKCFVSLVEEKLWLEEMALDGWFLKDITMGMWYTFEQGEPKRMLYEIDRFDLPKEPTLKEIRHKEQFLELAEETGWKIATHDEDLNYYFCKEYVQEESNVLYTDEESVVERAMRYKRHYDDSAFSLVKWSLAVTVMGLFVELVTRIVGDRTNFYLFCMIYVVFCASVTCGMQWMGNKLFREMMNFGQETWNVPKKKKVTKFIFSSNKLNEYLADMARNGWHIEKMGIIRYTFSLGEPKEYQFYLDSKGLLNKRRKKQGEEKITDRKDINNLNNDWQVESAKEAEKRGYSFVCAMSNNGVLYKKEASSENEASESMNGTPPLVLLLYIIGIWAIIGGVVGFICGFFMS